MKNKSLEDNYNGLTAEEILNSSCLQEEGSAAFVLGCSVGRLQRDRHINGNNPEVPYVKFGRSVRYESKELKKVIERSRIGHVKTA